MADILLGMGVEIGAIEARHETDTDTSTAQASSVR